MPSANRIEATAEILRCEMARQQKTGRQLASLWGVSQQAASRRLNAHVDMTIDDLTAIAEWLDLDVRMLIVNPASYWQGAVA